MVDLEQAEQAVEEAQAALDAARDEAQATEEDRPAGAGEQREAILEELRAIRSAVEGS